PLYPATDPLTRYPSSDEFADGYGLDRADTDWYNEQYAPEPGHWRAAPLAADLAGLPPTVLMTAGLDPLRDQGRAFAAKLVQAGVETTFCEAAGMVHGFATFRQIIPSAQGDVRVALDAALSMLNRG
ncbi:MAG TPA: alpha/beta hydrolase fold domain-containing protein, partial [Ilumatobacteraceae bacterium]